MLYGANACMCTLPRVRGAQLRRSQPAFIIVMVMKLVSVSAADKPGPCPFDVDPARGPRLRNPGPFRVRAPTHTFPAEEFKSHRFLLRRCGG